MNAILNTSYFIKHLPSEFQTHNGSNLLLYLVPLNFFTECANTNEEMWKLNNLNHALIIAEDVNFLERKKKLFFMG